MEKLNVETKKNLYKRFRTVVAISIVSDIQRMVWRRYDHIRSSNMAAQQTERAIDGNKNFFLAFLESL